MGVTMACFSTAAAQNAKIVRIGTLPDGEISQPKTTLRVDVVTSRHEITAGPYARYAQKYLGVAAPLAGKVIHEITSVDISESGGHAMNEANVENALHGAPVSGSAPAGLPVDKISNSQRSLEESARAAADQIFKLRRSRLELVTGEAGENVFGGGLASALAEIDRLEKEYLALFLGERTSSATIRRYTVIPEEGVLNYTVCRYSEAEGLLPDDDLSGRPVVLELRPLADAVSLEGVMVAAKPNAKTPAYRIAADVRCRIIFDGAPLASRVVPVYQLGRTIHLAKK